MLRASLRAGQKPAGQQAGHSGSRLLVRLVIGQPANSAAVSSVHDELGESEKVMIKGRYKHRRGDRGSIGIQILNLVHQFHSARIPARKSTRR